MAETLGDCKDREDRHPEINRRLARDIETYRIAEIDLEPSRGSRGGGIRGGIIILRRVLGMTLVSRLDALVLEGCLKVSAYLSYRQEKTDQFLV